MPPGTVVMVARRAAGQDTAVFSVPVRALCQQAVNQPLSLLFPFCLSGQRCQFLKSAGRDRAGNIVNPFFIRGLAEVAVRQAVRPDMRGEIGRDPFRRFPVRLLLQVPVPLQAPQ